MSDEDYGPCHGQDYCMSCQRHGDDCDGKDEDIWKCLICGEKFYEDEVQTHFEDKHHNRDCSDIVDNCLKMVER